MRTLRLRRMVRIHFLCAKKKGSIQPEWVKLNLWRRGRDSNPRVLLAQTDFESAPL